jgi:predicted nucleic acid-binding protein
MILFADTSALVKRYIEEPGSDAVDEILSRSDILIVSSVTRIELNSALSRRLKDRSLDEKSYKSALGEFNNDFEFIEVVKFDFQSEKTAIENIRKHNMKTLDAIQLSSVKLSKADMFITADKKLYDVALAEFKGECLLINADT